MRAARHHPATRHAENIMAGDTSQSQGDDIDKMEQELEGLRARKRLLLEQMSQSSDVGKRQEQKTYGKNANGINRELDDVTSHSVTVVAEGRQSAGKAKIQRDDTQGQSSRGHRRQNGGV